MERRSRNVLFEIEGKSGPEGFTYYPEFISAAEENELLSHIRTLEFKSFRYRGFVAKRRIVDYGWSYDFESMKLSAGKPIPPFLMPVREKAAQLAGLSPDKLSEALITEYQQGSAIDWHRDVPQFDVVVGISLLSPCTFRLRRKAASTWERYNIIAEPRSAYVLKGPARTEWQHSIPSTESLRYSITFRSRREKK
jgi:alkylated DNA repair dioxygenase AlkB